MNIKIEKKDLVALITKAGRGAAHNSAIPQLQVLYMEAANGKLVARATNMEFGIKTSTSELQFDEEGKVLVNAKYFENFVKSLPAGVISLEVKDNKLQVKYARSKANLNLLEGSDYPDWPECQKEVITIPGNLLRKGISAVLPAVAKNHFRMVFTGVLMDIKADKTIWVGSDTHRLAIIETEGGGNPQQLIIPLKTAEELLRVVDDEDVVVYTSGNNLLFKTGETEIFSRIINGQYPDVNAVISKDFVSECSVNTETFRQSIARILTLPPSEGKIQSAHLTLNGLWKFLQYQML